MRLTLVSLSALVLAACSSEPAPQQESAEDFANRIGQQQGGSGEQNAQARAEQSNVAQAAPPQGADVTRLEQLGDIAAVDLGPRSGGCTFMEGNREMIIAAGLNEPTLPGKAVIRVGGGLTMLDSGRGGLATIREGTTFTGSGVAVQVAPATGAASTRPANVTVTAADGTSATYSGNWICA